MPYVLDNIYAYRFLRMLVTPFEDTDAFKMGIIDDEGNNLIKYSDLSSDDQRKAYNYLVRLVFNLKKLINKLPGGENKFKNFAAAILMLKESHNGSMYPVDLSRMEDLISWLDNNPSIIGEIREAIYREMEEENGTGAMGGGGVANMTGANVSTDIPVISPTKDNSGVVRLARRQRRRKYHDYYITTPEAEDN